jgi:flagellar hook-length control protein FliK
MSSLPITPPKARVDPAPQRSASPPGGSSGETDFAALLSQTTTQARTAPAEGRNTRPAQSDQARRRDDDGRAAHTQRKDDAQTDATSRASDDPSTTQSQPTAKDATDPNGQQDGAQQQAGQDGDANAQGQGNPDANAAASTAAVAAAAAAQAAKQTAPVAGTGTVVADGGAAGATAQPQPAATGVAAQAVPVAATDANGAVAAATNPDGTPAGRFQLPTELLDAKGAGKQAGKDIRNVKGVGADGLPPAPTLPPSATAAATPTGAGAGQQGGAGNDPNTSGNAQAQPATPPTVAAAQPAATPLTAVPTAAGAPQLTRASVAQAAERVQELVRIATTRAGNARATLQLRPEALGQVDVQLRTTKDGLVATIAAHDQAGLDALQNAANELKRTLEDRGVQLHSLDLQLSPGTGSGSGFSNQGDARQATTGQGGRGASYDLDGDAAEDEVELTISRTPSIPAGELVDVTA